MLQNSALSALPYLVMFILNMIMSPLASYIIAKRWVSLGVSRKIFNSIGKENVFYYEF